MSTQTSFAPRTLIARASSVKPSLWRDLIAATPLAIFARALRATRR